jgi:ribulose-phosphate 3-epimerase
MVEEPRRIFSCFTPRKAEVFTIHYEASRNLHRDIVTLRKLGFRPGVVLNPQTPLESIEYVLGELHRVTILATHPGFDDHMMESETIQKVKILQEWRDRSKSSLNIAVDGGYTIDAVSDLASAGANHFVVGSSSQVKEAGSLQAAVRAVRIEAS